MGGGDRCVVRRTDGWSGADGAEHAGTVIGDVLPKIDIAALDDFARDRRLALPDKLGEAVRTLGTLDGRPNFKSLQNARPDHQVVRDGYVWLAAVTQAPEPARRRNETANRYQKLRPIEICVLGEDSRGSASSMAE